MELYVAKICMWMLKCCWASSLSGFGPWTTARTGWPWSTSRVPSEPRCKGHRRPGGGSEWECWHGWCGGGCCAGRVTGGVQGIGAMGAGGAMAVGVKGIGAMRVVGGMGALTGRDGQALVAELVSKAHWRGHSQWMVRGWGCGRAMARRVGLGRHSGGDRLWTLGDILWTCGKWDVHRGSGFGVGLAGATAVGSESGVLWEVRAMSGTPTVLLWLTVYLLCGIYG